MTNEELKNMLFIIDTLLDDAITDSTRQKVKDSLTEVCQLAIKALEQQTRDCKTCKRSNNGECAFTEECHECMWKSKYEQQPSEDCISRQAVLDCFEQTNTRQGAKYAIETLPSVTPRRDLAETSQDCISREEVQNLISRWLSDYLLDETREALETINYKVGDMPSVTPERPKGKWIFCYGNRGKDNVEKCSCCKSYWKEAVIYRYDTQEYLRLRLKYCPKCGAYMGGADETN